MVRRRWTRGVALAVIVSTAMLAGPQLSAAAPRPDDAPGTVIESESLPQGLWLPGTGAAQRVSYWTSGSDGRPAPSTGAIFLPAGDQPPGGWPVIAWAHGTVGLGDQCAPSSSGRSQRDITYLTHWLAQGYAIVATDYQGLGTPGVHPYLSSTVAAQSVIDMVRAAHQVDGTLAQKWVVVGQSQGGAAMVSTAAIARDAAPEFDFRGAVGTGVPSNLDSVFPFAGPNIPDVGLDGLTLYVTYVLAGLRSARHELSVDRVLTPLGKELVDAAETSCYDDQEMRVENVAVGSLIDQPLVGADFRAAFRDYLGVPTAKCYGPVFLAQGLRDLTVPFPLTVKLYADLRSGGTDVTLRTYPTDHDGTMAASLPDTTPFVRGLFSGP